MRHGWAVFAAWLGNATAFAASEPKTADVTVMPAFEVASLSSEFDGWVKVRSAHFVLYTDAGGKAARTVLREVEAGRAAAGKIFCLEPRPAEPAGPPASSAPFLFGEP